MNSYKIKSIVIIYIMGLGLKIKNTAQGIGKKVQNQIALGKKSSVGRKVNNGIQITSKAIQTLTPLEKLPMIGTGVKILTGVTKASSNISQFAQDQINTRNDKRKSDGPMGNSLERSTVMPRDEESQQIFV